MLKQKIRGEDLCYGCVVGVVLFDLALGLIPFGKLGKLVPKSLLRGVGNFLGPAARSVRGAVREAVDAVGSFFRRRGPRPIKPGQVASPYPPGRRVGGRRDGVRLSDPPSGLRESGAFDLTPDNLARMERGQPPIGRDGLPVNLHHRNQNPAGPLDELSETTHRTIDHPIRPSRIDRSQFAGERRRYWVQRSRELLGQE